MNKSNQLDRTETQLEKLIARFNPAAGGILKARPFARLTRDDFGAVPGKRTLSALPATTSAHPLIADDIADSPWLEFTDDFEERFPDLRVSLALPANLGATHVVSLEVAHERLREGGASAPHATLHLPPQRDSEIFAVAPTFVLHKPDKGRQPIAIMHAQLIGVRHNDTIAIRVVPVATYIDRPRSRIAPAIASALGFVVGAELAWYVVSFEFDSAKAWTLYQSTPSTVDPWEEREPPAQFTVQQLHDIATQRCAESYLTETIGETIQSEVKESASRETFSGAHPSVAGLTLEWNDPRLYHAPQQYFAERAQQFERLVA